MHEDSTKFPSDTRSILEQIGIDPRDFDWQDLAACEGYPTNFFFEDYERDTRLATQVDELCLSCPVARECFRLGVDNKSTGVFGGFYLNNGEPVKTRNAHKTPEVAQKLAAKVLGNV
jgi:hypothetical protein